MSHSQLNFQEYLKKYLDENTSSDCVGFLSGITMEDAAGLGLFIIRGFCGWAETIAAEKRMRRDPPDQEKQRMKQRKPKRAQGKAERERF